MIDLNDILSRLQDVVDRALGIWSSGGWAMWAIAAIAMVMFGVGINIHLRLKATGFSTVSERTWRAWIDRPRERRGRIGQLIDQLTAGGSAKEAVVFFDEHRRIQTIPFVRDLRVMKVCVNAAPLVGLLGTVTGMLATFEALSSPGGGDKTITLIAAGISEALITTMTGLVIALPGLFFQYQLSRGYERYKGFLAHLETVVVQHLHKKQRLEAARKVAMAQVKERLRAMQQGQAPSP